MAPKKSSTKNKSAAPVIDELIKEVATSDTPSPEIVPALNADSPTPDAPAVENVENSVSENVEPVSSPQVILTEKISDLETRLGSTLDIFKDLILRIKVIKKDYSKLEKTLSAKSKRSSKKMSASASSGSFSSGGGSAEVKKVNGFAKPSLLSDQLCAFLSVAPGTKLPRTEVTKYINEYIKKHELQDKEDKRRIFPDETLQSILKVAEGEQLTYFNLQRYLKNHFQSVVEVQSS